MQLKNKAQRERFLENYKNWELFDEVPELELKFYKYVLPNATKIIATEYAILEFDDYKNGKCTYAKTTSVNYHLILSENDKYKTYSESDFKLYDPSGNSVSTLVKYLTEVRPEVECGT